MTKWICTTPYETLLKTLCDSPSFKRYQSFAFWEWKFSNCFRSFFRDKNEHLLPPVLRFVKLKFTYKTIAKAKTVRFLPHVCMYVCNCNGYGICFRPQKYLSKHFHILSFPIVNVQLTVTYTTHRKNQNGKYFACVKTKPKVEFIYIFA